MKGLQQRKFGSVIVPDHLVNDAATRILNQTSYDPGETVGERDSGDVWIRTTDGWKQISIAGIRFITIRGSAGEEITTASGFPVNVVANDAKIPVFSQLIYSGTATGNTITANLQDYCDWTFHITGVDADDDVTIQAALDGTVFEEMGLVRVTTNSFSAAGTPIEIPGVYKFAAAGSVFLPPLCANALKVTRNTAATSTYVTVYATARPV